MIGVAELAMTIVEIAVDATVALLMAGIVGVGQGEAFQDAELGFDQVQPGSLGRGPHRPNAELFYQGQKVRMVMNVVQIVEDHKQTGSRIAAPQPPKGVAKL